MVGTSKKNWPAYLIEAWCLGTFMLSACLAAVLLFGEGSRFANTELASRNVLMGVAMGMTAIAIICSPWGRRSGAHFNPAVTLTFLRLGMIRRIDAVFYVIAQFAGGLIGILVSWMVLGSSLSDASVNFVATVPGTSGVVTAFIAEFAISFVMMAMVLFTGDSARWSRLTPYLVGFFLAIFIAFESPLSGTSLNPARTFSSAVFAGTWSGWWIYFIAPPLAMLAAAECYVRVRGVGGEWVVTNVDAFPGSTISRRSFVRASEGIVEASRNERLFPMTAVLF